MNNSQARSVILGVGLCIIAIVGCMLASPESTRANEQFERQMGMTNIPMFVSVQNLNGTFARVLPPKSLHGVPNLGTTDVKLDYGMHCVIGDGATFTGLGADGSRVLASLNQNPAERYFWGEVVSTMSGYADAAGRACLPATLFWIDTTVYYTAIRRLESHERAQREANADALRDRSAVRRILDEQLAKKDVRVPAESPLTTERKK